MIYRDPKCVYVGADGASANMIAGILGGAGYPAQVMNEATAGFGDVTGYGPGGMEVWVINPDHVEPAKKLIEEEMKSAEAERDKRAKRTGTVAVVCEDCGKSSDWSATAMGTTEVCQHCAAYMDIPDPDDDWSDVDFGEEEDQVETKE